VLYGNDMKLHAVYKNEIRTASSYKQRTYTRPRFQLQEIRAPLRKLFG
jgi:hypothetical protein